MAFFTLGPQATSSSLLCGGGGGGMRAFAFAFGKLLGKLGNCALSHDAPT